VIDILIPTLGRHRALQPLAANILNATPEGSFHVIFVADEGDTETRQVLDELCFPDGPWAQVIEDGTYPHKTNAGYRSGSGDLVLPTADDVRFMPGWLDSVLNALSDPSVQVVGTDDLSPSTADRTHATMPVLRRSYCESPGASWQDPGKVFHEGFHHLWCETEICGLAQHRGVWAFAEGAAIEHRHPDWGSRERDATDEKGNGQNNDADKRLFENRQRQWRRSRS
jgi:glycosyltransferase involved in cell wall biosynthesis